MRAGVGTGLRRSRTGLRSAATFARHHWSRPAYSYLAIVGIALLITLLFYWHSGFNYDECRLCGLPLVFSVSPWWLLLLPFDVPNWPLFAPLLILLLAAVVNAELVDRYAKRPQAVYPDWE
jgi:hypothetical protein